MGTGEMVFLNGVIDFMKSFVTWIKYVVISKMKSTKKQLQTPKKDGG